jgi:hypothetical protein
MSARSSGFGGKLFLALLLALACGYLWACFDAGRNPLDILKLFSSRDPAPPPPPPPAPAAKDPAPPVEPAPAPVKEPVKEPVAAKLPPPPAAPKFFSAAEMASLFASLDDLLRRGRFFEANGKIRNTSREMIPADQASRFSEYDLRVQKYYALVQETTMGVTIEMPKLHRVFIKGGTYLTAKILSETPQAVSLEDIRGIRDRMPRERIEKIEEISPPYAAVDIKNMLKRKCGDAGVEVADEPGKPLQYKDKPGRRPTGIQFFDLADFCARNGANDRLLGLFDEALRRDPDLKKTVHDVKGKRLVDVFLFFLSINSASDAQRTLRLLRDSYADTQAYRELLTNSDAKEVVSDVLGTSGAVALAPRPPEPAPAPGPRPAEPAPPPLPPPAPVAPEPGRPTAPGNPLATALPDGLPPQVRDLVARGDQHYREATKHLDNSDPNSNPEGWAAEVKLALELFNRANQECYFKAQDLCPQGAVPQALLDRVRETQLRARVCRVRSVSSRK